MLEGFDYDSIDNVWPFIGAPVDAFCENTKLSEVKETSTRHVDLVRFVVRRGHETCWNEESLELLQSQTVNFKVIARITFSTYQPFRLLAQKCHALYHSCKALKQVDVSSTSTLVCTNLHTKGLRKCMQKYLVANGLLWMRLLPLTARREIISGTLESTFK